MGRAFDQQALPYFQKILQIDQTEIDGLDDLHNPEGAIAEAQRLTAQLYGADQSYFLVNGSTSGNLAMIMAVCKKGDPIIVQRNVHKSVIHGLMLAGALPIYVSPKIDEDTGIAAGVAPEQIKRAIEAYPEVKAVLITYPNYYGMGSDVEEIAAAAHAKGIPLLVDEAHGAHYGFHPDYPKSSVRLGADIIVQSMHKMGTSLTMGGQLHVVGNRIDRDRLTFMLSVFQSSSPSYPIMASLDVARRWLYENGTEAFSHAKQLADDLRYRFKDSKIFHIFEHNLHKTAFVTLDPLKITVQPKVEKLSGFQLKNQLSELGCPVELADLDHILLVLGAGTRQKDINRLSEALIAISAGAKTYKKKEPPGYVANKSIEPPEIELAAFSLDQWNTSVKTSIPLRQAAQRVSAEMIIPYPPGVPFVHIGEQWTADKIEKLMILKNQGARFHGTADPHLNTVQVIG